MVALWTAKLILPHMVVANQGIQRSEGMIPLPPPKEAKGVKVS